MLEHIQFDKKSMILKLLDQRSLPDSIRWFSCGSTDEVITAIGNMVVRGAPAIGVTAAYGCVLAAMGCNHSKAWRKEVEKKLDQLIAARPTAVNLAWAVERMRTIATANEPPNPGALVELWLAEALAMQGRDVETCRRLGHIGQTLVADGDTILTHCNAGALATAGYGTALGVVRAAFEAGKKIKVIADETRPFCQGSRLTAFELAADSIPVTVACDSSCAHLMSKGLVQIVITGADRIAANGDTANKIGTLGVAILARHFNIPFYIAAPLSTIDLSTPTGADIPIESRPASEVTSLGDIRLVPENVPAYNFAFDVTPASLIDGIITEAGILRQPYAESLVKSMEAGN